MEAKWQKVWEEQKTYKTNETDTNKATCYALVMFPYPSGSGLHVGHARVYVGADIYARMKRMQGLRVLHPMGWDAFGLPAEGYALKEGKHPKETTAHNTKVFKQQCKKLGLSYDWDREINTTDPEFYKWTQWIFLQLYKKGLVYESHAPVNWCPSCKTGLANEDLNNGTCERCESVIERKPIRQWVLRITEYADRLLDDLQNLSEWQEYAKEAQRNWIGRRDGYTIPFQVPQANTSINVFTTRPETLFGCSFLALSTENNTIETLLQHATNRKEVEEYRQKAYVEQLAKGETTPDGILLKGITAKHPLTNTEVPIYIATYVLNKYGTGAIFGAPAHDERDFSFAKHHNLPIKQTLSGKGNLPQVEIDPNATLINAEKYNGTPSEKAKEILTKAAGGTSTTAYKLQDWVFSRQRYWGEPIPLIHCQACGVVPVPEKDLPVILPEVKSYKPTDTGESPLATEKEWIAVPCPVCGTEGKRETNTMPQWAGSSWYHLRYIDPHNSTAPISPEKEKQWMPVTMYTGGMEHATRHLIYARFWHKALFDIGTVSTHEPYTALRTVGIVQAEGGGKMSKRSGNVINPITVAEHIGADATRVYLAHMAPFSRTVMWNSKAIAGPRRFLERIYALQSKVADIKETDKLLQVRHQTTQAVTKDIEGYRFNTAVSALMTFTNELRNEEKIAQKSYTTLLKLLAPFAPFLCDELWATLGNKTSIHLEPFPQADEKKAQKETVTIAVQVQGKIRGEVEVPYGTEKEAVLAVVQESEHLTKHTNGLSVKAFVPNRVISFA